MPPAARPPSVESLVALADRCVQCGLCLPVCPTYGRDRLEAESPRGRIALMRAWALEAIEPSAIGDAHLDHCLGCRSCEAVCPAGVQYDELLVLGRSRQRERRHPHLRQRLIEVVAARPRLLTHLFAIYRRIHGWLPRALRPLPRPPVPGTPTPRSSPSATPLESAALFVGCVANAYEVSTRDALGRLCTALQVDLMVPSAQTCCGSLHAHAGNRSQAERLAARNRDAFAGAPVVLTLASGCHDSVARSLRDATTQDALGFLDARADRLRFRASHERIALHLPCTQRNAVGSVPALRRLLSRVPGLEVVELTAGFGCCGAAGTQMLTDPGRADDYRRPLLAQLEATGATRLLSANIGCRLHLGNGTALPVLHPVDFLAQMLDTAPAPLDHPAAVKSPT